MEIKIGKGLAVQVDVEKLGIVADGPAAEHIVYIGLRNILMDAHAGVTREEFGDKVDAESLARAEAKLAALYAGEVRRAARERDPVQSEANKLARGIVAKIFAKRAQGWKIFNKQAFVDLKIAFPDFDWDTDEGLAAAFDAVVENQAPRFIDAARAIVEQRKAVSGGIDLSGLKA